MDSKLTLSLEILTGKECQHTSNQPSRNVLIVDFNINSDSATGHREGGGFLSLPPDINLPSSSCLAV